jgi:hypothetical protein
MKIAFSQVASLIRIAFPEAKGRRPVGVRLATSYHVEDYWDGGSRTEARFVELATGRVVDPNQVEALRANPMRLTMGDVAVAEGYAVIEHSWFCGKDCGYSIRIGTDPELSIMDEHVAGALSAAMRMLPAKAS